MNLGGNFKKSKEVELRFNSTIDLEVEVRCIRTIWTFVTLAETLLT